MAVDITGENKEIVRIIAKYLGGEVGSLPKEKIKPSTEVLIIVSE